MLVRRRPDSHSPGRPLLLVEESVEQCGLDDALGGFLLSRGLVATPREQASSVYQTRSESTILNSSGLPASSRVMGASKLGRGGTKTDLPGDESEGGYWRQSHWYSDSRNPLLNEVTANSVRTRMGKSAVIDFSIKEQSSRRGDGARTYPFNTQTKGQAWQARPNGDRGRESRGSSPLIPTCASLPLRFLWLGATIPSCLVRSQG